jgi:glycosyltransferase involved in cell wall biosynthesis
MDVLPTPLWLCASIKTSPATLYYCHFPDKLLTRDTVNGIAISSESSSGTAPLVQSLIQPFRRLYRGTLDALEEYTLPMADFICVNSEFTKQEVERVFPSIQTKNQRDPTYMQVLYPPIDLADFIPPQEESSSRPIDKCPIVSLNRFERKKNIGLLLNAYALLVEILKDNKAIPPLVIAGGYDVQNVENVEYLAELRQLASTLGILDQTLFRPSVSDQERAQLLQEALVVVYTPDREHFGIVPLEAMYAGSPVVAVNSGGPRETVRHEETGFLCANTPASVCEALHTFVRDPDLAHRMGQAGHRHVTQTFGLPQFRSTWSRMVTTAMDRRLRRRPLPRSILFTYLGWSRDVMLALLLAWLFTFATKTLGLIPPSATVWGHVKHVVHQRFAKDEF